MQQAKKQPHIQLDSCRPCILVVGDPARAAAAAAVCDEHRELAYNREYRSFDCRVGDQWITVASHGVGSAGATIAFEEFITLGAKCIIRAGTAGSLRPSTLRQGHLCVCEGAVREEGVSSLIVPQGYPAVAAFDQTLVLREEVGKAAAKQGNVPVHQGVTLSSDLFYKSPVIPSTLELYAKAGVDIVEMEVSALFVVARIRGVKAAAVCVCDGSPLKWEEGDYDPHSDAVARGKKAMLTGTLNALARISRENLF